MRRLIPFRGRPETTKQGTTVTYLLHDQLGSLVSATNSLGQEVFSARYWPLGSLRTQTAIPPTYRLFTGQTRDPVSLNTNLNDAFYWFRSRYLDTTIGKFHTPDSIVPDPGNPQALNRYSYVLNQLLKFTDPTGHALSIADNGGSDLPTSSDGSNTASSGDNSWQGGSSTSTSNGDGSSGGRGHGSFGARAVPAG